MLQLRPIFMGTKFCSKVVKDRHTRQHRLIFFDCCSKILKVTKNGSIRWKCYYWVYLSAALKGKHLAIEDKGNGIWKVFYRNVFLGYFDEKNLRNIEQSTRLETNLV
jgi:hypothetical protein